MRRRGPGAAFHRECRLVRSPGRIDAAARVRRGIGPSVRTPAAGYLTAIFRLDDVEAPYLVVAANRTWKYQVPLVAGEYV